MKVTILQHSPEEPPGLIGEFLKEKGISFVVILLYTAQHIPEVEATHLVILGGPMSANDEGRYPFLGEEKSLIRHWIGEDRPTRQARQSWIRTHAMPGGSTCSIWQPSSACWP